MSMRCMVCNALNIANINEIDPNANWECQNCGSIFDVNGNYVTVS